MFCREALAELGGKRRQLEAGGTQLAFVHLGGDKEGQAFFDRYGLGDVPRFSDPRAELYRALGLRRTSLWAIFTSATVLRRGWQALRAGHVNGVPVGDPLRMPGVFLLHRGRVLKAFRHETVADVPAYDELAACPLPPPG